jgi:hypothetical protein
MFMKIFPEYERVQLVIRLSVWQRLVLAGTVHVLCSVHCSASTAAPAAATVET